MNSTSISKIYLASKSPRRHELLKQMNIDFEPLVINIPEVVGQNENYLDYSIRICKEKSISAWKHIQAHGLPTRPVLTADTEVIYNNQVIGKPNDYNGAFKIWKTLSGNKHLVITSITLKYNDFSKTITNHSWVYFDTPTDNEIHNYLKTGDYKDKSGAYGIQSYAGQFIQKIEGCFYSVMGLPLNNVRKLLSELSQHVD